MLHDEPLTPFEAMQLDPDYLGLVNQALTHAGAVGQFTVGAEARVALFEALPGFLDALGERPTDTNHFADGLHLRR